LATAYKNIQKTWMLKETLGHSTRGLIMFMGPMKKTSRVHKWGYQSIKRWASTSPEEW